MDNDSQETIDTSFKAVLYADGGYHQTASAGGWGVHGYVYSADSLPVRSPGGCKAVPMATGYVESKDRDAAVDVVRYVDAFGGVSRAKDNNHTELLAVKHALKYALDTGLSTTLIYSDSKHVVKGLNEWMPRWKQMGWRTHSGNDVAYKEDWMKVDDLLTRHKERQSEVELAWIKGHAGHIGNEMADDAASKGNALGLNGNDQQFILPSEGNGYWKKASAYNRFFDQPKWYFSSDKESTTLSACGRHIYWTGQHGEDEYPGKPQADTSNAVIYLKEEIPLLSIVREHFVTLDVHQHGHMFMGSLRNIFKADIADDISRCGMEVFRRSSVNMSIASSKKLPIVTHASPAGLIYYNVENLTNMQSILDQWLAGDNSIIQTDLTDLLYETVEKKKKATIQLRKSISNTVKHLDVDVNYNLGLASDLRAMSEVPVKQTRIRLIVGTDIIGRNALAALAPDIKRVVALTWRESDTVLRHATVIETQDDIGIWTNPFGNFKLVK